ncbi:MAG: F0F1 ATP synthase subunit A [Sediminibacterium sp.]|nr:F0F1 ATP synthase subunit A [Sediminibacterium sp.]
MKIIIYIVLFCIISTNVFANEEVTNGTNEQKPANELGFNPANLIMEHVLDAHEFHFFEINGHKVAISLPVILYSPTKGWSFFNYNKLEEGQIFEGYKSEEGKIIAVNEKGEHDIVEKFYDFSLTRNVVQLLLSLILLCILMLKIAKKYAVNGVNKAPSGFQNAVEPVITFIRDEVGKPNLGKNYQKYMPFLLTIFFFILINNLIGLIPGTANVTGNIAFTALLGLISFIVIIFSTNKHYWAHIFNPDAPFIVKFILVPVELIGVFTKPFALIIRLFANMIAGHIVITCLIMLIFIFAAMNKGVGWGFSPISLAFTIFIYLIEILVVFIQAFIFTNLTAVFIGQAKEGDDHHDKKH